MIDQDLISSIKQKKDITIQAIYQSVRKIRKEFSNSISKEEAAFIYAARVSIDIHKFFKNDPSLKNRISDLLAKNNSKTFNSEVLSKRQNRPIIRKILKIKDTKVDDPLLSSKIIEAAKSMSEVYPLIYIFENSIRNFVRITMDKAYPGGWWNEKRIPNGPKKKAESRKKEEGKNLWHGSRSNNMLDYIDLDELENIISHNTQILTLYFRGLPKDLDWLKIKIKEIYPSRNVLAHNNPLSKDDIERVKVICRDWQKQLPNLKLQIEVTSA
jgi:hypothetical protein